ncbi:MAG: hypothetical protein WAS73_13070 [Defluviicoccus sp.]
MTDSVLDHDPVGVVPLPVEVVEVVEPEPVQVEPVEPDFDALIERERERLADAEAELDRVLLVTVWNGMGRTIEKAEAGVAIARRKIRSLELRRLEALATADAKREAARRKWIEEVAAEVDDTIAELAERCRVFVESVETAQGALRDAAALADRVRLQRRSVRLRCNNGELAAFEQGRSLPSFGLMALLEKTVAVNVLDLATAFPGAAPHIGVTRNAVTLAKPLPRSFDLPLARVRRGFTIDPGTALQATGKFGGQRREDDDDAA